MDDWQSFLAGRPVAVLATVSQDGTPHAVPVEVVVDEGRVYVWCHSSSVKARNVERARRAALTAYQGGYRFVLVRGPARLLSRNDARFADITAMFLRKYEREETYGNDVLVEITAEHVTGR